MITVKADVQKDDAWKGKSTDLNTGLEVNNLDSSMKFSEHQRIVVAARSLIGNYTQAAAVGHTPAAKTVFSNLKACYTEAQTDFIIKIAKGIHQMSDPHLQLQLHDTSGAVADVAVHLDVDTRELPDALLDGQEVPGTVSARRFHWQPLRFCIKLGGTIYCWPLAAAAVNRSRGRRNSISHAGLKKAVDQADFEKRTQELGRILSAYVRAKSLPFIRREDKQTLAKEFTVTYGEGSNKVKLDWDRAGNSLSHSKV
jgi:hypothetical protein